MKKSLLILTAVVLAFFTVPVAHADSMVKLDVANGLIQLSADPNVKIPVKARYSEVKGQPVLELDLKGGAHLKGIVNARVTVNGKEIAAENVDQVGSKLVVTLDKNLLHAGSSNQIVVDLGIKIADLDVVKLQICLNLSADVMLQAKEGKVTLELTGCKNGDDGSGDDGDDGSNGDDGNNDDDNGNDDGNNGGNDGNNGNNGNDNNHGGGKGADNDGGKGGSLPNHKGGGELPKTATSYPALSLIGALLLLAGAGLFRLKALRR